MTRKEFEECTGLQVSAVEFCTINDIYMAAGEMDKDTFCKEWKQHGESKLLAELWHRVKREHDMGMENVNAGRLWTFCWNVPRSLATKNCYLRPLTW